MPESAELLRLVGQAPLTVLFGKSGLGKTSLVQAGLFPRLRQQNVLPVYVRLDVRDRSAPLIQPGRRRAAGRNRQHGVDAAGSMPSESLWEHLHGRHVRVVERARTSRSRRSSSSTSSRRCSRWARRTPTPSSGCGSTSPTSSRTAFPADLAQRIEAGASAEQPGPARPALQGAAQLPRRLPARGGRLEARAALADAQPPAPAADERRPGPARRERNDARGQNARAGERRHRTRDRPLRRRGADARTRRSAGHERSATAPDRSGRGWRSNPPCSAWCARVSTKSARRAVKPPSTPRCSSETGAAIIGDFYQRCVADVPEKTRRFIEDALITEGGFRNSYPLQDALDQGCSPSPCCASWWIAACCASTTSSAQTAWNSSTTGSPTWFASIATGTGAHPGAASSGTGGGRRALSPSFSAPS